MKKTVCAILALMMSLSMNTTVLATNSYTESAIAISHVDCITGESFDDTLNGNMRGLNIPTQFWDLGDANYNADLEYLNVNWVYTNYYFEPNLDGELYVTYTIFSDTGRPTQLAVGLYDLDDQRMETTWTSSGSTRDGITEGFKFINMDISHRYAIAFTAVYDGLSHDSIHGSAVISQ